MPETTSTSITEWPDFLQGPLERMIETGENLASEPYNPYPGPRLAGFNDTQQQAFDQVGQYSQSAQPYLGIAGQLAGQSTVGANELVGDYMNPFLQAAIDPAAQEMTRSYLSEQNRIGAQAGSNNAFGGSRQALLEGGTQRNYMEGIGDLYAGGLAGGYDRGMEAALADQRRRLDASDQFGELGRSVQTAGFEGADAMARVGGLQQLFNQTQLDTAYGDFQRQEEHPYSQLSFMRSLISGAPQIGTTQTTTQQEGPDRTSQLLGAGVAGLGILGGFDWG